MFNLIGKNRHSSNFSECSLEVARIVDLTKISYLLKMPVVFWRENESCLQSESDF